MVKNFLRFSFYSVIFLFALVLSVKQVEAGCNIGGASSQRCYCGLQFVDVSPCCDAGSENGSRWESCGTDSNNYCVVKSRCAGSINDPPDPASCFHKTCGGGGRFGYGCTKDADVWCNSWYGNWRYGCENAPGGGCYWDGGDEGSCQGHSCQPGQRCSQIPADYSCEDAKCDLISTDTTNVCKGACTYPSGGGTCGYGTCANECGGFPNCGYIACPTEPPSSTPTPTPSPTPTPTPTPTPNPFPAWFQTAGGMFMPTGAWGRRFPIPAGRSARFLIRPWAG